MAVDVREKLVGLANDVLLYLPWGEIQKDTAERIADRMMDHGVTVQEWISVKDRLPDYGQEVVVYGGNYLKSCVTTMRFWDSSYVEWFGVTHWQPLPQPPKGG